MPLETVVVNDENLFDILIIGAGPAGLTAAVYGAKAGLKVGFIERSTPGGKVINIKTIYNFPGVAQIEGTTLAEILYKQAIDAGAKYIYGDVVNVTKKLDYWAAFDISGQTWFGRTMIIATGTSETKLNIPGEKEYSNIGVSYCATCDGHLTKGKKVAIFGGTEEAVNSAIYLSKIASSVSLFVPTEQISSVVHNLDVVKQLGVSIVFNAKPLEFFGNTYSLTGGNISIDNEIKKFSFDFAFINEGYSPSTDFISDQSIINESKIVIVNPADKSTNLKGLFAVGDVSKEEDRQIITATSDGTIAALSAIKLLQQNKK